MIPTPEQLNIMRHALGYDDAGINRHADARVYRNRYAANKDDANLDALVKNGWMVENPPVPWATELRFYYVTDIGKPIVVENKPVEKKATRSESRYQSFLDADCGLTFIEWLKSGRYQEARRR